MDQGEEDERAPPLPLRLIASAAMAFCTKASSVGCLEEVGRAKSKSSYQREEDDDDEAGDVSLGEEALVSGRLRAGAAAALAAAPPVFPLAADALSAARKKSDSAPSCSSGTF